MARCQWCTAPLPTGGALCRYCGRRNDVDLRGLHEFTVAPPDAPRICPACGVPMQTLDLKLGGAFCIERCERCLSLFFDPNEVETLLEQSTAAVFEVDHARLRELGGGPAPSPVRYYPCPVCRTPMHRVNFGARSGVIVDRCPRHGMWLESGELRRLLEWRRAGGQILDERRRAERQAEERRREDRRAREEARTRAEAAGETSPADLPEAGGEAVTAFVKAVLRLIG